MTVVPDGAADRPPGLTLRRVLVVLAGLVAAGLMVLLGLWQLEVYASQGQDRATARAAEPPVPLPAVAPAAARVGDGYGRSVRMTGRYLADYQVLVPVPETPGRYRLLTAFRQDVGGVVPVVRGLVDSPTAVPVPPAGPLEQTGVLLPSEDDGAPAALPPGQVAAVRVPELAQTWPGPLVGGYVTLQAADATAQGLAAAPLELPEARGRLRNGAYALQWWVFAAFAIWMSGRIARDLGRQADLDALDGAPPASAVPAATDRADQPDT